MFAYRNRDCIEGLVWLTCLLVLNDMTRIGQRPGRQWSPSF